MTRSEATTLTSTIALGSPQEVAAALPHLLGFHPEESLICLWLRSGELVVVQRADLMGAASDCDYIEAYLEAASNIAADDVVIVCVTRDTDRGLSLVHAMTEYLGSHVDELRIRGRMIMSGGQVRSADPGEEWHWISADHRQRAHEAFGSTTDTPRVRRNRREVVSEVEYDEAAGKSMQPAQAVDVAALCSVLVRADLGGLKDRALLRDAALGVQGRDLIMWWCSQVAIDRRRDLLEALVTALRGTPRGLATHLACAAAATAWLCGDGVRANAALDRCLDEDPGNSMGRLLESAMAAAVPPAVFGQMLAKVPSEVLGATQAVVDSLTQCGYSPR